MKQPSLGSRPDLLLQCFSPCLPLIRFRRSWLCGRMCHTRSKVTAPGHVGRTTIGVTADTCVTPLPYPLQYRTTFQTMGKVAADEGFLSLYKGLLPVIIGSAPEMAVQVSTSWFFSADPARASCRPEQLRSTAMILDDQFDTAVCGICFFIFISSTTITAATTTTSSSSSSALDPFYPRSAWR
jgi:hypothetical protein